jgi:hypothetical protein
LADIGKDRRQGQALRARRIRIGKAFSGMAGDEPDPMTPTDEIAAAGQGG